MSEIVVTPADLKLGADPELFVRSTGAGKPWVSAHDLVLGTKEEPHVVDGGAVQHDGMAAEYNIDPATTADEFVANNNKVLKALSNMLENHELVNRPFVAFGENIWLTTPEDAKELGCAPDINAYTRKENDRPDADVKYRTAAGHIHVGWTENMDLDSYGHTDACNIMAKELDAFLGVPFAWLDNSKGAIKRRKLYGQAGAYRVKPYGMEYRVLSNFWVGNETLMRWIFENTKLAFTNLLEGKSVADRLDCRYYIDNTEESRVANIPYLCEEYNIPLPKF